MNALHRYFHGDYGAARAHLLSRAFFFLVALDAWTIMLGHSAKYGFRGFNTAHFAWLDALIPGDNRPLYQAVLFGCGLFAMLATLLGGRRPLVIGACLLHWLSWSMSMLDSYQHHYFTSLVLTCMAVWPQTTAQSVHPPAGLTPTPSPGTDDRPVAERPKKAKAPNKRRDRGKSESKQARGPTTHATPVVVTSPSWMTPLFVAAALVVVVAVSMADFAEHLVASTVLIAGFAALATWLYRRPPSPGPTLTRGFGYPLLGATIGIMYTYTSIAKLDWDWLEGHTMQQLTGSNSSLDDVLSLVEALGFDRMQAWSLLAVGTIAVESAIALGYLLAPVQDRSRSRVLRGYLGVTWALAMGLHVGIESINLRIGWFSYYMLVLGSVYMLPLPIVDRWATVLTWPAQLFEAWVGSKPTPTSWVLAVATAATIGLVVAVGARLDLPGAELFVTATIAGIVASALWQWPPARRERLVGTLTATAVSVALLGVAVTQSRTRFDFYRRLGKDYSRQLDFEASLEAYLHAERYAPPGESRADTIRKLRKKLGQS